MNPSRSASSGSRTRPPSPRFTPKQGQYLAFIYYYAKIHGRPPAEAELQRFFRVTTPVVHEMINTLAARGFIDREPGTGGRSGCDCHGGVTTVRKPLNPNLIAQQ